MKKLEYQELLKEGLCTQALEIYSNTEPLAIYKNKNGNFDTVGIFEEKNLTIKMLNDLLLITKC